MTPAGRVVAVMLSSPPRVLMTRESFAPSDWVMLIRAASPSTETELPAPTTSTMSSPLVPLAITVSAGAVAGCPADRRREADFDAR